MFAPERADREDGSRRLSGEKGLRWIALCREAELWAGGGWDERWPPADEGSALDKSILEIVPNGLQEGGGMKLDKPHPLVALSTDELWAMTDGEE